MFDLEACQLEFHTCVSPTRRWLILSQQMRIDISGHDPLDGL